MRRRTLALTLVGLTATGLLATVGLGWQLARPVPRAVGSPPAALQAETIGLPSESGATIHGWFSPVTTGRGAVLLLPPIRENRTAMTGRAEFLRASGYSTLLIDFQGTGESVGNQISFGWRERLDVLAAVAYLRQRLPGQRIAILGVSLGGAAALLATPPLAVEALILEAVYPDIATAVHNRLRMRLGPAGSLLAPLLLMQLRPRLGVGAATLRPVDHIGQVRCPILIIGGSRDGHTTEADTRHLHGAAPGGAKLWLIPDAAHVNFFDHSGSEYRRRVLEFLTQALGTQAPEHAGAATP